MKIQSLEIKNIRGIKKFKIEPKGQNVIIFGPNGAGKSAVVDAVDFLLTGKISRLIGEGTKSLKLKEHGCHVDSRANLGNTNVKAKIEVEGKEVFIERSINKPALLNVEPPKFKDLIESYLEDAKLGQHILSRREILRYVTAESGKRAKEIMTLLKLKNIDDIRDTFVQIKNNAEMEYKNAESSFSIAKSEVSSLLSLETFSEESVLDNVNDLRSTLDGSEIKELSNDKFKENLDLHPFGVKGDELTKEQVENYIKNVKDFVKSKDDLIKKESELKEILEGLKEETELKQFSLYKRLFEVGLKLSNESNVCPLCDREWETGDFKTYLEEKMKETEFAKEKQNKIDSLSLDIKKKIDLLKNNLINLIKAHSQFKIECIGKQKNKDYFLLLDSWSKIMSDPLECFVNDKWLNSTSFENIFISPFLNTIMDPLNDILEKEGEMYSKQQYAWDTLTKMEDKWDQYQKSFSKLKKSEIFKKRAVNSLDYFEKARDSVLENIYRTIEENFDKYYKTLHSSDEESFNSKITPKKAELAFEVDFYGRGMFPPHALHSEGHQDSMGLCLFLALNNYLTKDSLKIIVLDDVVMSIDSNHRKAVCDLLINYFKDKQFIMTTHDTSWAKQLQTHGVVTRKNLIHFVNWNIDTGPIFEMDNDLWDDIKENLNREEIPAAAHKLRWNGEYFFEDVCDLLNAKIQYKGNHDWGFGDFSSAAVSTYKAKLDIAKKNAKKMGNAKKFKELDSLSKNAKEIINKSQIEQWIINKNVHYNKWAEFSKEDFEPVVEAFKKLFGLFTCDSCGSTISVSRNSANQKIISCSCGDIFWNIEK